MSEVSESEFWAWVASEKQAVGQRQGISVSDLVAWLKAEKEKAEKARFSYLIRREDLRAAYEEGRLEVINEVLLKLKKFEKRLDELGEKAKFMKQFEAGSEFYEGFLEALKEVRA